MTRISKRQAAAWGLDGDTKRRRRRERNRTPDYSGGPFAFMWNMRTGVMLLTLPVVPSKNDYKLPHPNGKGFILTPIARAYRKAIAVFAVARQIQPIAGDVDLHLYWYRESPQSGEAQNREEQLFDALQGVAYFNDKQIRDHHTYTREDPRRPRMEVRIESLAEAPLLEMQ